MGKLNVDVNLSEKGVEEAKKAGRLIKEHGLEFDQAYTSLLTRAIKTLHYALEESDQLWIPDSWECGRNVFPFACTRSCSRNVPASDRTHQLR